MPSKRSRQEEEEEEEEDEELDEIIEEASENFTDAIMIGAEASIIQYEARRYEEVMASVISAREILEANQDQLFPALAQIIEDLANAVELLATPLDTQYEEEEEEEDEE